MNGKSPFDRAALRAYIDEHGVTEPQMAAHAGVPYRTLRGVLLGAEPLPATRAAIEEALTREPPPKPSPRHAAEIAALWPHYGSVLIGRRLEITSGRVRQIAKLLRLPPQDRQQRRQIE